MKKLIATKALRYAGRLVPKDGEFSAKSNYQARVLIAANLAKEPPEPEFVPVASAQKPPVKRVYKTRVAAPTERAVMGVDFSARREPVVYSLEIGDPSAELQANVPEN